MEDIYGAVAPTDPLGLIFDKENDEIARYDRVCKKWPNVSDEEYLFILNAVWVEDWFEQYNLCHMRYQDFLKTRYWRVISQAAKKKTPYCQDCFEYLQQLHVHHKTYVRRGLEWLFPDDLIVLCHSCHRERHGK